ncbi:outer membrane lipoprotein carrier protein LolA [Shewanella zhangzhouensis]|uniref:outer membrane lipoprotein carrier protein LolA n=1 Tax=Shewanella zhangzhouensis TaxID=2864213 RepID=UPI001C65E4D5|nr:outer membrane lipoprotein carrier protein LolA [Shewanella zhangzhouensis]QYK05012.1 outer membrane lipoprotein carrier protein LolA [Shewanella zhangzhouensis]
MGLIVKFCIGILTSVLVWLPVQAEDTAQNTDVNLGALSTALKPQGAVRGEFEQTRTLKALKRPLVSRGSFVFSPEQGLMWAQSQPFENLLILSETRMLSRDSEGLWQQTEVDAKAGPATLMPMLVKAMMGGDVAKLAQHFSLTLNMTDNRWQLSLTPKDDDIKALFAAIELEGSFVSEASPEGTETRTNKASTDRLKLISPNGDVSDIRFSKQQSGPLSEQERQAFSPQIESGQ